MKRYFYMMLILSIIIILLLDNLWFEVLSLLSSFYLRTGIIILLISFYINYLVKYQKEKKKNIKEFLKIISDIQKKNNLISDQVYEFKRFVKYENKLISLGSIVFDKKTNNILIYETFYNDKYFICKPDIWLFNRNKIKHCKIMIGDSISSINELDKFMISSQYINRINELKEDIFMLIEIDNYKYSPISIRLVSVNDYDLFKEIYYFFIKKIA